jgi:hypothetical protein
MMKFGLFFALAIATLAIIAAFGTGGENDTGVRKYDYRTSADTSLPFTRHRHLVTGDLGADRARLSRPLMRRLGDT